ncbi:hypothetical protein [Candidatus Pantoea multigeneris]|uniref:Toxin-activating lysine-acyltransferase n=1 Tax=Candidatus Pantoea multigeneris TaxID=2608357 RepID=A0ABX0R4M6_9GAMM|nr:hypothetical protein [Pantoea multigeneris]NIF20355.1 hypothetical protein [Pantoea multigeneris]
MDETALHARIGKIHLMRMVAGLDSSLIVQKWAYFSASADKVSFLQTPQGATVGYVLWASVNRDTWRQLKNTGRLPVYRHEWSEGKLSLILDVVVIPEWRGSLNLQLLRLRRDHAAIYGLHRDRLFRYHRPKGKMDDV